MTSTILSCITLVILFLNYIDGYNHHHRYHHGYFNSIFTRKSLAISSNNADFDAADFEKALKSMGPVWNTANSDDKAIIDGLREEQDEQEKKEEIFRKYPFDNVKLPILPDCNNYYSGKFGDYFWHQNADQVYVFIPVDGSIGKNDVDVKFEAKRVVVSITGKDSFSFDCLERIIPDGSFWVFEEDKNDKSKKYLLLDLEKRLRMINWKNLFGPAPELKSPSEQNDLLQKLFAANKGMAKIMGDGASPESIKDMLQDEKLMRSITEEPNLNPKIIDVTDDIINKINSDDITDSAGSNTNT